MNVRGAATRLEVSPATVYALVASGRLRCYRVGMGRGSIRIAEEHLQEYLEGAEPVARRITASARPASLKHLRLK